MINTIKKQQLQRLFYITARAFECTPISIKTFSFDNALTMYAISTSRQATRYLNSNKPVKLLKHRLYRSAYRWGTDLRRQFHIKTQKQAILVLRFIYKQIGIHFHCNEHGEFCMTQCMFSHYYSPKVCRLISALDAGLAAGLCVGTTFRFEQRITEGCDCCCGTWVSGRVLKMLSDRCASHLVEDFAQMKEA